MKKFEYKVIDQIPSPDKLNELGKDGWELCTIREGFHTTWARVILKREVSNIDYAGLLIACAHERNVVQLQHRTISEFAQFVEDVMSSKNPEYEKYQFDFTETDAIRTWIEKFYEYCKEYYAQLRAEVDENEMKTLNTLKDAIKNEEE